ncbi:MerR family transcriptional regulator [Leuconostoc gelidum]|uniref:MerR family transcriptional regulator n=1 Tax=Leuconostoc gelidum TaxID=1244 RepID=UPI001C7CE27A|nr:MerR family transcriptional regulator [Leuconostoc gelidum]MBZ6009782.1 MerR family transcriptional regulator [Leuconostoc gelidum subsp. aenigmaticum]
MLISELAKLSGVTTRSLRYYDQIGILRPQKISSGYRIYNHSHFERLQIIVFYRDLGIDLATINNLLSYDTVNYEKFLAVQKK